MTARIKKPAPKKRGRRKGWRATNAMRAAFMVRLPTEMAAWLWQKSVASGLSMSEIARQTLEWRMEAEASK